MPETAIGLNAGAIDKLRSDVITLAFKLTYALVGEDRQSAYQIITAALLGLETSMEKQEEKVKKAGYYRFQRKQESPKTYRVSIRRPEMFQNLIFYHTEKLEVQQERAALKGQPPLHEYTLIIRFLKKVVYVCLSERHKCFHYVVAVSQVIYDYGRAEAEKIYALLVQDDDYKKMDSNYRDLRRRFIGIIQERFKGLLTTRTGAKGKVHFLCQDRSAQLSKFVEQALNLLSPWESTCVINSYSKNLQSDHLINRAVAEFSCFNSGSATPSDEDNIEMNRRHTLVHSVCFRRLVGVLNFTPPEEKYMIPRFFSDNGQSISGSLPDLDELPDLTDEELKGVIDTILNQRVKRYQSSARILKIVVDGEQGAEFDIETSKDVSLGLGAGADLIQVFAKEQDSDLLLCTLSLKYSRALEQQQTWSSSLTLEGGQKITLTVSVAEDSADEFISILVKMFYEETSPVRALSFSLRRNRRQVSAIAQRVQRSVTEYAQVGFAGIVRRTFYLTALVSLLLFAVIFILNLRNSPPLASITSLAILPQVKASDSPDSKYLSYGIAVSTIKRLSRIDSLTITGDDTAYYYLHSEAQEDLQGKLKVDGIVKVTVSLDGKRLIVRADLIETNSSNPSWSKEYDLNSWDIISVQEEIAGEVSKRLGVKLSVEQTELLTKRYTDNSEAHRLYLKGRYFWNIRKKEELMQAIQYFKQAIELDPSYAIAYAGLADSYILLPSYGGVSTKEAYPLAEAAALRALEIDNTLAEAHTSLAQVKEYYHWDWSGAERGYRQAIKFNPNYATAHHWYGYYLTRMGRFEEGISELRRALELDPLSLIINTELGWAFMWRRQYDQAVEQLRNALELKPDFARALEHLGETYALQGKFEEAVEELIKADLIWGVSPEQIQALRKGYLASGWQGYLQKQLEAAIRYAEKHGTSAGYIATMYARLGKKEEAFKWLEKAYEAHEGEMGGLKVNPHWDNLRGDPRFADLIRRVGLPQ